MLKVTFSVWVAPNLYASVPLAPALTLSPPLTPMVAIPAPAPTEPLTEGVTSTERSKAISMSTPLAVFLMTSLYLLPPPADTFPEAPANPNSNGTVGVKPGACDQPAPSSAPNFHPASRDNTSPSFMPLISCA